MKLRKSFFSAFVISLVVYVVVGILALIAVLLIPSSPFVQQIHFIQENHSNPAVYTSQAYIRKAQDVATWDFWITFPVLIIAGIALGLRLANRPKLREPIIVGIVSGAVLAALTLILSWSGTISAETQAMRTAGFARVSFIDWHYVFQAAGTSALWVAAYTVGTIGGYLSRRGPGQRPPKAGKRAKTPAGAAP